MKKFRILVVTMIALLLASASTLAETPITHGVENIPDRVLTLISESRWNGWEITGWVNPSGLLSSDACAFAVVKNSKKNVLLAFGWQDDSWIYKWYNAVALPQVKEPILLCDDTSVNDGFDGPRFSSYYIINNETMETRCFWVQKNNGSWRLIRMYNYNPLMFYDTSVENALRLYNTGRVAPPETDVWVYGTYQTDLRYFSLGEFPKTVSDAREKLSNPPQIPSGTLSAKKIHFSSGKKLKVYQGPGEGYGQSGGGKAIVSTNDWIQVFGEENQWLMIQYDISSNRMRIGWIPMDALPRNVYVNELSFRPVIAETIRQVSLTDDPLFSKTTVIKIPQGTKLNWLATMGEWAYVETTSERWIRGFVLCDDLVAK